MVSEKGEQVIEEQAVVVDCGQIWKNFASFRNNGMDTSSGMSLILYVVIF